MKRFVAASATAVLLNSPERPITYGSSSRASAGVYSLSKASSSRLQDYSTPQNSSQGCLLT